jgi:copper oxidase (laccase) domain-containing protein
MKPSDSPDSATPLAFGRTDRTLVHAYSSRQLGNMSVSRGDHQEVLANRRNFCDSLDVTYERTFLIPQTHSTNILILDNDRLLDNLSPVRLYNGGGKVLPGASDEGTVCRSPEWEQGIDGVITRLRHLFAMVTTADCAPVGFRVEGTETFGLAHAGLIGAINRLPARMVTAMVKSPGVSADQIQVSIGPCIRKCHYDLSRSGVWKSIGETVLAHYGRSNRRFERGYFDLPGLITDQLVEVGIEPANIHDCGICTACRHDLLYSNFMAGDPEAKAREGRFATILGYRPI